MPTRGRGDNQALDGRRFCERLSGKRSLKDLLRHISGNICRFDPRLALDLSL
jgi:hypothetical protein